MVDLSKIEEVLKAKIFPELDAGRPNWDKPHTECVVTKIKEIIEHSPELSLDVPVLIIAAYAHDWGYAGLFKNGQKLSLGDVKDAKEAHALLGVERLALLLQEPVFDSLTKEQKERAIHLVKIHDNLGEWKDTDELILMEADTLGGLDTTFVTPSFDEESNRKYMNGVREKRIPYFITEYGKKEAERLFKMREDFYRGKKKVLPNIIEEVGFDFHWEEEKVWALDLPVEDMPISELEWHLNVPFWFKPGGFYDLKPRDVINDPKTYEGEYERTMKSDLKYPLDIMFWKGRWLLLDGLHRLVKAKIIGQETVKVRKVSQEAIPLISK